MKQSGQYYWYHNDQLGTPQMMTNSSGAVVWSAKYSSFGKAAIDSASTVVNPLRFAGQYYDQETGLHYNYHRYYDPALGRYLRTDPIGLEGGINLYAYVQNNPVNAIDPYGLVDWGKTISGAAVSFGGAINVAIGTGLIVLAGAEVESVGGIPFAAHTFGAGAGLIWLGGFELNYGMTLFLDGVTDWERKQRELIKEAERQGRLEAEAELAEMERQYSRINEWLEKRENECP
jgi:RHS repeat-associated protein